MKRGWRLENAPRVRDVWRWSLAAASSVFNSSHWHWRSHTYTYVLYVLGVAPRALLCRAKLLYYTEDLLNMSLMCSLFMRGGKKTHREELRHTIWIKWKGNKKMHCNVICVTSLYITAIFIIWDMVRWAAAQLLFSHIIFRMGCFCRYIIQPQPRANIPSPLALIPELVCFHILAFHCATGNFFFQHGLCLYIMMRGNII